MYRYADVQEFLEKSDSSRAVNVDAIIVAASKMKNLTYNSFSNLLKQMCSMDMTAEDFFELADEKKKDTNDETYNEVKHDVLCTEHVDPDNLHETGNDVGFGILSPVNR